MSDFRNYNINGKNHTVNIQSEKDLLEVIEEHMGLDFAKGLEEYLSYKKNNILKFIDNKFYSLIDTYDFYKEKCILDKDFNLIEYKKNLDNMEYAIKNLNNDIKGIL